MDKRRINQDYSSHSSTRIRKRPSKVTFTKSILKIIVAVALIDIQLPFILAFMGREQIAETLGGLIVTEIIGVFLVYCLKSFFETREECKNEMKELEMEINQNNYE